MSIESIIGVVSGLYNALKKQSLAELMKRNEYSLIYQLGKRSLYVHKDECHYSFEFYVLTHDEVLNLIKSSNDWYANQWSRKLKHDIRVGVDVKWLDAKGSSDSPGLHPAYTSSQPFHSSPFLLSLQRNHSFNDRKNRQSNCALYLSI